MALLLIVLLNAINIRWWWQTNHCTRPACSLLRNWETKNPSACMHVNSVQTCKSIDHNWCSGSWDKLFMVYFILIRHSIVIRASLLYDNPYQPVDSTIIMVWESGVTGWGSISITPWPQHTLYIAIYILIIRALHVLIITSAGWHTIRAWKIAFDTIFVHKSIGTHRCVHLNRA